MRDMRSALRQGVAGLAGMLCLTLLYGFGSFLFATETVSYTAWVSLYGVCALVFAVIRASGVGAGAAGPWLAVALHAALFAVIFFGAGLALDALHGVHRAGPDVAGSLGGLALWFVLCPGVVSVALGQALSNVVSAPQSTRRAGCPPTRAAGSGNSGPRA